jgi:glycosyltransferase involved in cell wall biosynthesis
LKGARSARRETIQAKMTPVRPIRVCFLIDRLTRGGTETQLLALIRALDRSRFAPALVLLDGEDDESRSLEPADCPVVRLGVRSLHRPHALAAAAKLRRFWRDHGTDVVQVYFLDSAYFGVPLARLAGVRRVVRVRNNLGHWLTPKHRWLGRLVAGLADVTLTNCEPARRALLDAEGGDARKVVVLENGVDLDRFASLPPPAFDHPEVVVGTVANLRPVKGIDVLARAAARVVADLPHVRFRVAGQGEQRPELARLVKELGLGDHFELAGPVADVPEFLAGVDLAVLPSRAEGMSNALLEAMAAGRAVVATDVGANGQLLRGGELGVLVPPEDAAALAAAVGRLVRDPASGRRLGAAARREVDGDFIRDGMRGRFAAFYQRLCS